LPSGVLHRMLSRIGGLFAGHTKAMVRGHQTRESTEDSDESRTQLTVGLTSLRRARRVVLR